MKKILFSLFFTLVLVVNNYVGAEEITEEKIKNFTYHLSFGEHTVTLKNGEYKKDAPDFIYVWLDRFVIADLDDDELPDAAVVLIQSGGGSGTFYELTALLSKTDGIVQTNSIYLGDRIKINKFEVKKGVSHFLTGFEPTKITLDMLTHRETDPMTSPSNKEVKSFSVYEDKIIPSEEVPPPSVVKKPAIYLYPEKTQKIEITLNISGKIIQSIPQYNKGWSVSAGPDGTIDGKYHYLFYEAEINTPLKLSDKGWIVPYNKLNDWFDKYLILLGLNKKEASDFKNYWLNKLQPSQYYIIKVVDRQFIDKNLGLKITPTPQTIIRVILYFESTKEFTNIKEPEIIKPTRKGFTVVEWGGIDKEVDSSDIKIKSASASLKTETKENTLNNNQITQLKKELIDATVKAIEIEIKRYEASQHTDKEEKIAYLQKEVMKFKNMKPENYIIEDEGDSFKNVGGFGPLMPPIEEEVEVAVTENYEYGSTLEVANITRSGPFYHIAGIKGNDLKYLNPGKYKVKLYLVYKREYFGFIPNYYVYIADKK